MSEDEKVLFIIPNVHQKEGFLKTQGYRLVLTNQRVIFAKVTKEMQKEEDKELKESLKGKSIKERMGTLMTGSKRVNEKYQAMSIDEILSETEGNFCLSNEDIRKVKRPMGTRFDENGQPYPRNITIHTQQGKHILKFHYAQESDEAYRILKDYTQ